MRVGGKSERVGFSFHLNSLYFLKWLLSNSAPMEWRVTDNPARNAFSSTSKKEDMLKKQGRKKYASLTLRGHGGRGSN